MLERNKCPDQGTLRTYLDRQLAPEQQEALVKHIAACEKCRAELADLSAQASLVTAALDSVVVPTVDSSMAWSRFRAKAGHASLVSPLWRLREMKKSFYMRLRRPLITAAAVCAVLSAVVFVPPVRSLAGNVLDVFRANRITVIRFNDQDARALGDFGQKIFTDIVIDQKQQEAVANASDAARLMGRSVLMPDYLPSGYKLERLTVTKPTNARTRIDLQAVRALLEAANLPTTSLPTDPDDTLIQVHMSSLLEAEYYNDINGDLVIFQSESPEVSTPKGLDLPGLAEVGLRLLGRSPEEARSLSQRIDWAATLVIPVPQDIATAEEVTVRGAPGYIISDKYGRALIWEDAGMFYAISGNLEKAELLAVAEALR